MTFNILCYQIFLLLLHERILLKLTKKDEDLEKEEVEDEMDRETEDEESSPNDFLAHSE